MERPDVHAARPEPFKPSSAVRPSHEPDRRG
jgi:hypothetical protein